MAEYIERSVAVNLLIYVENRYNRNRDHKNIPAETLYRDLCDAEIQIGKIPASDVDPVVHGRWTGIICTHCELPWNYNMVQDGDDWGYMDPMPDFCPNCGAKMDKEAHDEQ